MRWTDYFTAIAIASISAAAGWGAGCGGSTSNAGPVTNDGGAGDAGAACTPCVQDSDCNGGVCAQIGGDSYCTPVCPNGNECTSDRSCATVSTVAGAQVAACVPLDACGVTPDPDAGAPPQTCGSLVGPNVAAMCPCSAGHTCTANGCYGGYWCNTIGNRCTPAPRSCATSGDSGVPLDAGGPVTSQIDSDGGTESRLYFAIVGDTRPANIDDTPGYPTPIITKIWSDIAALEPMPPFTVSTGDYQFSSSFGTQAAPQLDLYLGARAQYPGVTFPAMGNHECTGATASNCGAGTANGITNNYTSYLTKMLGPIGKTDPFYEIDVNAQDMSWTSKFLFVAANAWTDAQGTWLDGAMARATTYTFIVRHEPAQANTAPGVDPSEAIMAKYPYTLSIVGHTHTYEHFGAREVVIGNGGAPLSGSKDFGYGLVSQRADGSLAVDMVDYTSGLADGRFHFAVKADGTPAP
jgi:hypothetical protein